jgi:hypothetical protein
MARQNLSKGTTPGDGTGTTAPDAVDILENNFNDLYGAIIVARKSADQIIYNSATKVNDTHLLFSVPANARYALDGWLNVASHSNAYPLFAWSFPTGLTLQWTTGGTNSGNENTSAGFLDFRVWDQSQDAPGHSHGAMHLRPLGIVNVGSTAGTLQLRWGQANAGEINTTLKEGSWLRLTKI